MTVRVHATALRLTCLLGLAGTLAGAPTEVDPERLREHVTTLASDAFAGRAPGTDGEVLTIAYLEAQFAAIGLTPAHPDGTFRQPVPLTRVLSDVRVQVRAAGQPLALAAVNDYTLRSRQLADRVELRDSEIVFAGYGVQAPELGRDDYRQVDVRGRTVLLLAGEPPADDHTPPAALAEHGRTDRKIALAARLGAAACLLVHEPRRVAQPFAVIAAATARETWRLDYNDEVPALEGWITREFATRLAAATGHEFAALRRSAARADFQPVPLGAHLDADSRQSVHRFSSANVAGLLPGSHPSLRHEYIVCLAHWDHLGRDDTRRDPVFNGAADNASGLAVLIEVARAFAHLPPAARPRRSLLFLATTAEENGLLGSRHYVASPLFPLADTVAAINLDGINHYAPARDIAFLGAGLNSLETDLAAVAAAAGRYATPATWLDPGLYFRSDHLSFARVGIPALHLAPGRDPVSAPRDFLDQQRRRYFARRYHQPGDEVHAGWSFEAVAQEAALVFDLLRRVADADGRPSWREGAPYTQTSPAR